MKAGPITIIVLFFLTYKAIEVVITNMSALDSFFFFFFGAKLNLFRSPPIQHSNLKGGKE